MIANLLGAAYMAMAVIFMIITISGLFFDPDLEGRTGKKVFFAGLFVIMSWLWPLMLLSRWYVRVR